MATLSLPAFSSVTPRGSKRELAEKIVNSMVEARRPLEQEIYEIASLAQPNRSRHVCAFGNNGRGVKKRANRLFSSHAIRSFRYLTGGMYSGMSSPNRPWFAFQLPDRDLMQYAPVKWWLADTASVIAQMLATSNFYGAKKIGYSEIGLFGTDACIMAEGLDHETGSTYPVCYPQTFGEYWISCNDKGEPNRLVRKSYMTVENVVKSFVPDRVDRTKLDWSKVTPAVQNAWSNGNYQNEIPVWHVIEENPDWTPGNFDDGGKPWRSMKWEEGQSAKDILLEEAGFHSQPFWAPRWEVTGSDDYGFGPGHDALTDMRVLQLQAKRKGEATDMVVKPPLVAPSNVAVKFSAGSVTYASQADMAKVQKLLDLDPRSIEIIGKDVNECKADIDEATFARLFMAISNLEGSADRTVAEIAAREEEKLTQLGPVIERVNNEGLAIAIDRAFDIAVRNEMLAPPPPELGGMPIEIDFTSILAQAQKMVGIQQTERALSFVATLDQSTGGSRGVWDNVDTDKLVTDIWTRTGASPEALRDDRVRDQDRAQAAEQARAAQATAQMGDAKAGAEAVKTLAETPVDGGDATFFDKLIGV